MEVEKFIVTCVVGGVAYKTEVLPDFDKSLAEKLFERVERQAKDHALKQMKPSGRA